MNFPSRTFFNDINQVTKQLYERKILCGCIWMWFLIVIIKRGAFLKYFYSFSAAELNNIESEDEVFAQEFSCKESDF